MSCAPGRPAVIAARALRGEGHGSGYRNAGLFHARAAETGLLSVHADALRSLKDLLHGISPQFPVRSSSLLKKRKPLFKGGFLLLLYVEQSLFLFHAFAGFDANARHFACPWRFQFVLHLHRFEDYQDLPFFHFIAFVHWYGYDQSRHWGLEVELASFGHATTSCGVQAFFTLILGLYLILPAA